MMKSISLAKVVVNVELSIYRGSSLRWKNGASFVNELSTQDKGVRPLTLIHSTLGCFANRSHGQGVVVKEDELVKGTAKRILASEKTIKVNWNCLKRGKVDFALITTHAKLGIVDSGVGKGFSTPVKGMARRAFNDHPSKAVNLPSRIKGLASNGKLWWLWEWLWQ
jgi:hypothetical protein